MARLRRWACIGWLLAGLAGCDGPGTGTGTGEALGAAPAAQAPGRAATSAHADDPFGHQAPVGPAPNPLALALDQALRAAAIFGTALFLHARDGGTVVVPAAPADDG